MKISAIKVVLERVKENINLDDNIIITDHGSTDGTIDFLKKIDDKNIKIFFRR